MRQGSSRRRRAARLLAPQHRIRRRPRRLLGQPRRADGDGVLPLRRWAFAQRGRGDLPGMGGRRLRRAFPRGGRDGSDRRVRRLPGGLLNKAWKARIIAAIQEEAIVGRPRELTAEERRQLISEGYRPVEMWVPDLSDPQLLAKADAEAKRIAKADQDEDILDWIEAVQKDMWEGEDRT
ncbi:DUF3018 family protein [Mesorhizobium sp. YM1C-6-2]|nr:DUF3018 family protein [Mesorhizobium sp. YM1C-6-2]